MNGNRYILDTNAVIALLNGKSALIELANNAEWIAISIISYLEFLSFPNLSDTDRILFNKFAERVELIDLHKDDEKLINMIIKFRNKYKIKLPDSIIISTAYCNQAKLVTADKELSKLKEVSVISF